MATFTALAKFYSTKFFCNTKVAGLGKIFIERNFYVRGTHKLCIDLLTVYLCVNIVAVVDVDYPCSFSADYDILGWFHELLKDESDEELCDEMQTRSHL